MPSCDILINADNYDSIRVATFDDTTVIYPMLDVWFNHKSANLTSTDVYLINDVIANRLDENAELQETADLFEAGWRWRMIVEMSDAQDPAVEWLSIVFHDTDK